MRPEVFRGNEMECKNRSTLITDDMEMAREQEWIFQRAASFATTYYK